MRLVKVQLRRPAQFALKNLRRQIEFHLLLQAHTLPLLAQPQRVLSENNITIKFEASRPESEAAAVMQIAQAARKELTEKYNLSLAMIDFALFSTTYDFCQQTRSPWWLSSVYQNGVIYLQPVRVLHERGILADVIRHEVAHRLLDLATAGNCPRWLSEALAIYHSGEIAHLKPQHRRNPILTFAEFDEALRQVRSQGELEAIYFQLYRVGRFLEDSYGSEKISALLQQLHEKKSWEESCPLALGSSAAQVQRQWQDSLAPK